MQLTRHPANPILSRNPDQAWEAGSVFNAGAIRESDGLVRLLYRATNDVQSGVAGGYMSSVGYAQSRDGVHFERRARPLISPDQPYESGLGCEDPRVTKLGDTYYLYYTAVADAKPNHQVRIALATTKDFVTVQKHGIVGPRGSKSKAAALLPEAINGDYIWYYTWQSDRPASSIMHARYQSLDELTSPPADRIARSLEYYGDHVVVEPRPRQVNGITRGVERGPELGAPPIKTPVGWLFIYCGTNTEDHPEWNISAALLDSAEPWRVIAQTPEPILRPETPEELEGVVNHVTFPSGAVVIQDELYVYYGSGDQGVCLATCKLQDLLDYLLANRV